jgi:hypothetical protein
MRRLLLNLLGYYLVWFACVLSASHHYVWIGITTSIAITAIQGYCQARFDTARHLLTLIIALTLLGFAIDSVLLQFDLFHFQANPFNPWCSAPWMVGLWINFAFMLYAHLRRFFLYYWALGPAALFGFPLAYYSGVALGAASLPHGWLGLLALGVIWAVAFPGLLYCFETYSRRNNRT